MIRLLIGAGKSLGLLGGRLRETSGNPLASQPIPVRVVVHVCSNVVIISGDAETIAARCFHEFSLIEETDREVFYQVDRELLLPGISALMSAPFDIAGPSGHGGQVQG